MVLEENDTKWFWNNSSTPGLVKLCMSTGKRIRKHMSWQYGPGIHNYSNSDLEQENKKEKKPTAKSSSVKEQSFTVKGWRLHQAIVPRDSKMHFPHKECTKMNFRLIDLF